MSNGGPTPTNACYVRLRMPGLDVGDDWDKMVRFYQERGEALLIGCSKARADHGDWMIFNFHNLKNAEAFAEQFGGEVIES